MVSTKFIELEATLDILEQYFFMLYTSSIPFNLKFVKYFSQYIDTISVLCFAYRTICNNYCRVII